MRTIHVSPDFPLNRRMRRLVARGKLEVARTRGESLSLGGEPGLESRREFVCALREIVGDPCGDLRPFVCDGFPLECEVFLVGYNPASGQLGDFWQYFNENGFGKKQWFRDYKAARRLRQPPAAPVSKTRRNMELLMENIRSSNSLDTNLYAKPSKRKKDLDAKHKDLRVLKFLLERIRPRVLVAYNGAQDEVCQLLEAGEPRPSKMPHAKIADGKNGESVVLVKRSPFYVWPEPRVLALAKLIDELAQEKR